MARAARIILYVLIGLFVLLAVAVFAVTRLIDPNDFKPQITALADEHAGITLDIQGDLGWTFWPSLGVSIGRTEARIGDDEELFAALDEARVGVAIWPLLFRRVEMDAITLSGVDLNLIETEDGGNWERIAATETAPEDDVTVTSPEDSEDATALDIPVKIPLISLSDSRLRYRNTVDGTDITVEHLNVRARDVQLDQPFPVTASLRYQDQDDIRIDLNVDTVVGLDLDNEVYTLDPLRLDTSIGGITASPIQIRVDQRLEAAMGEGRISIRELVLNAAGITTTGEIHITGLNDDAMQLRGQLDTEPFAANTALRNIGEAPIETSDSAALRRIGFSGTLSGPANSVILDPMTITLDDSTITGKAGITNLDSMAMMCDLALDRIALDGYLPPSADEPVPESESSAAAPLSEEPILPLEALRELALDGKLSIGQLAIMGLDAKEVLVTVSAADGLLRLTRAEGKTLEGSFSADAQLDARTDNPTMAFNSTVTTLQVSPIIQMLLDDDLLLGLFDMKAAFTTAGNSEKALFENAKGGMDLGLTDATVRGVNLHGALTSGLNDMLGNYQALARFIPGAEDGRLPRELREDTEILDLDSRITLKDMIATVERLDAQLDRGASLKGNGWLNIHNSDFDLTLRMKAPEISSQPRISEREWPLRCAGNLAGSPARWCLPSSQAFRDAGRELVARLASDQLGVDRERIDAERERAEERVREERDRAEDQVRDRAREQLDRLRR
ncbi:AsmA family protein [Alcanivorax sp. JB21]|uniref:AsmA family protein n=1 Tax=Alcanivorax limicola TaxID=2874102 RepID=UPI001CBFDACE|nr:AsmA family protein [Alcanivorax limicola]MBZ2189231.1 AsmA family protein [Alcanivorax limicola]